MDRLDMLALWNRYGSLLWEVGKHKNCCQGYVFEMQALIDKHQITRFDNTLTDAFRMEWRANGNKNSTINRKLACLGKLLRRYQDDGNIASLPNLKKYPERNGRIRFLTVAEQERLFGCLDTYNSAYGNISRFLVDTGARFGEAAGLRWSDVEISSVTFWDTKNNHPRSVPLTRLAHQAVLQARRGAEQPGPFVDISYQNYRYAWLRARKACGLGTDQQVVPHILRHTCASRLAQSGIDIKRIQEFLGHKSLTMTLRYAHLSPHNLLDCAMALEEYS